MKWKTTQMFTTNTDRESRFDRINVKNCNAMKNSKAYGLIQDFRKMGQGLVNISGNGVLLMKGRGVRDKARPQFIS